MNTACLIAACSAASRHRATEQNYHKYSLNEQKCSTLMPNCVVRFRKYYYFELMTLTDLNTAIKKVIPSQKWAVERNFYIEDFKYPSGVNNYVKENFEYFTSSTFWQDFDEQVLTKYVVELNSMYNIAVSPTEINNYSVQFTWEVTYE